MKSGSIKKDQVIPNGWELVKLAECFKLSSGFAKPKNVTPLMTVDLPIPVYGGNGIMGFTDKPSGTGGTIIIGRVGEYCGITKLITGNYWITDNALYITELLRQDDLKFLAYKLQFEDLSKLRNKGGQPLISQKPIYIKAITLPPLLEQKAIARILSTWDRAIEKTERLIEQKQKLKKGLMQQLLTGKVRFKEFVKSKKFKKTKLGMMPEDWKQVDVSQVVLEHKQGYYTTEPYKKEGRYLLLRGTDMLNPAVDLSSTPRIDANDNDYALFKVRIGDFLIVRSGGIGRYGIITKNLQAIFGSYLIRFRFDPELVSNDYFGLFYQSFISINQLKSITQGSSNININAENIKSLQLPLPPLQEQKGIVALLLSLENQITARQGILKSLTKQKHGLMQKLLTGQIRAK